jgi:hypothetical protein
MNFGRRLFGEGDATMATGGIPNTFLKYSRWDVISAFHKELRRGDIEQATYWLQVMIDGGAPFPYIANYLWQVASEELALDEETRDVVNYIAWCRNFSGHIFPYHLYYATALFCKAKKWWEDDLASELRQLWAKHAKAMKDQSFQDIPEYAHDKHTAKGKKLVAAGEADRRWEGSWAGMVFRREAWMIAQKTGRDIKDIAWDEVWGSPEGKKNLAFWEFMEANVC